MSYIELQKENQWQQQLAKWHYPDVFMHGLLTMVFDIRLEQKDNITFCTPINFVQLSISGGIQAVIVLLFNDKRYLHNNSIHVIINLVNQNTKLASRQLFLPTRN